MNDDDDNDDEVTHLLQHYVWSQQHMRTSVLLHEYVWVRPMDSVPLGSYVRWQHKQDETNTVHRGGWLCHVYADRWVCRLGRSRSFHTVLLKNYHVYQKLSPMALMCIRVLTTRQANL